MLVVQDELREADAIVVIGGDHKPDRIERAVWLFEQGYAPLVILSAGTLVQEGEETIHEVEVLRRQALALGLPEDVLILEGRSLSTYENASYTAEICRDQGVGTLLLVTSAYHSRRARRIFKDELEPEIEVLAQPATRDHHPLLWWLDADDAYVVLYEYKNWFDYWFRAGVD